MNTITSWFDYWNRKVRKLTIVDLKLIQVASMAVILIVAKLLPQIMTLSIWWFVALLIVCAMRPVYVFWFMHHDPGREAHVKGSW